MTDTDGWLSLEETAIYLGMGKTALYAMARENRIPILVFSIHTPGAYAEVMAGRGKFTIITEDRE